MVMMCVPLILVRWCGCRNGRMSGGKSLRWESRRGQKAGLNTGEEKRCGGWMGVEVRRLRALLILEKQAGF